MIPAFDIPFYETTRFTYLVVGVLFATAWFVREFMWARERKEMLDRLMAKSLPEFKYEVRKDATIKEKKPPSPFPDDAALAKWEQDHLSQIDKNNAEAAARIEALKRRAVTEVSHGS